MSIIESSAVNIVKKFLDAIDAFTMLQLIWIIEANYLLLNSVGNMLLKYSELNFKGLYLYDVFIKYNSIILAYLNEYREFVLFLAYIFILVGIVMGLVAHSFFVRYDFIKAYGLYGLSVGIWLFISYVTYVLYSLFNIWFPLILVVSSALVIWFTNDERTYEFRRMFSNHYM